MDYQPTPEEISAKIRKMKIKSAAEDEVALLKEEKRKKEEEIEMEKIQKERAEEDKKKLSFDNRPFIAFVAMMIWMVLCLCISSWYFLEVMMYTSNGFVKEISPSDVRITSTIFTVALTAYALQDILSLHRSVEIKLGYYFPNYVKKE